MGWYGKGFVYKLAQAGKENSMMLKLYELESFSRIVESRLRSNSICVIDVWVCPMAWQPSLLASSSCGEYNGDRGGLSKVTSTMKRGKNG